MTSYTQSPEKKRIRKKPKALDDGKKLLGDKVFQQDGAPIHASKKAQEWCKRRFWRFIDKQHWPPNSPDLNPLDYYFGQQ